MQLLVRLRRRWKRRRRDDTDIITEIVTASEIVMILTRSDDESEEDEMRMGIDQADPSTDEEDLLRLKIVAVGDLIEIGIMREKDGGLHIRDLFPHGLEAVETSLADRVDLIETGTM